MSGLVPRTCSLGHTTKGAGPKGRQEPPAETVRRELEEEPGLGLHPGLLLCIDWASPHGPWDDSLMFIFGGGILNEHQIANLSLHDNELRAFKFCTEEEAAKRLRPYVWRRTHAALDALRAGKAPYLQDGPSLTTSLPRQHRPEADR